MFFMNIVGVCDSNEADVLSILEGVRLCFRRYFGPLIVKHDYYNGIA